MTVRLNPDRERCSGRHRAARCRTETADTAVRASGIAAVGDREERA